MSFNMPLRYVVEPSVYAAVVEPGTYAYRELEEFQTQSFGRLRTTRASDAPTYHEATHTDPSLILPIAVRRLRGKGDSGPDELIGMARLELAGATLIESMIQLREGSAAEQALASHRIGEVGSFVVADYVEREQILNVVDAIVGVLIQIARAHGIQTLWVFPRSGFMSILRAEIPGVLPPYRFTLSPDIAGWKEDSAQLATFRAMRLKGFIDDPIFYQISVEDFAADLERRQALLPERDRLNGAMGPQIKRAMISTERALRREIAVFYPMVYTHTMIREREERLTSSPRNGDRPRLTSGPRLTDAPRAATPFSRLSRDNQDKDTEFLPAEFSTNLTQERYLNQVIESGGNNAQAYKELSYKLLDPEPGMRILDVGCGTGVDLPALSELVGPLGSTVGLEINSDLAAVARQMAEEHKNPQASAITILHGDAQHMTIPEAAFERVRTDRALQHFADAAQAVAEMWRVLTPGGVLTLVEPDWGSMVVSPGAADSRSDATVTKVFAWIQRQMANPFIGRQLNQILRELPQDAWKSAKIVVAPFTFNRWDDVNNLLLLGRAAQALSMEQPALANELQQWLEATQRASENGTFFGYIPIFYGVAVKSASIPHTAIQEEQAHADVEPGTFIIP